MPVWDELKGVIRRLRYELPGALVQYPDPDHDEGRQAPLSIYLAPWAATTAADLFHQFGQDVNLIVGALPYPPGPPIERRPRTDQPAGLLDPDEVTAELDGPAEVRSGHTLRHGLLLHNHTDHELQVVTNGQVTAIVVRPATGEPIGGFAGAQTLPRIVFRVAPGATQRIPLLIGTASLLPELGYAVPAGPWGIQATLELETDPRDSLHRRTPVLPLTIVD